mmetsp:Transcript_67806/g.180457  ORF Transcript_67806/g.180457 Transcript_67806/m.180457 type:complete len:298 (-) Transcript_67806:113-1006(-)
MSFFAAPLAAMVSVYSACSFFLMPVASETCLSSAAIPSFRAATSSARAAMLPSASSMALPRSDARRSSAFFSSSDLSISDSQYAFFWSSAACSLPRTSSMLSIILTTLSKEPAWPRMAMAMRSTPKSPRPCLRLPDLRAASARRLICLSVTWVCRSAGLGKVDLKSSRDSSSLKILMVSAIATNSSERVLDRSSHSAFLVAHPCARSARNFLSSIMALVVSSKSSFRLSISTPTCPTRPSLDSIAAVLDLTSLVFAAARASKSVAAFSSAAVMSARPFSMVSFICSMMPTIWPLRGA